MRFYLVRHGESENNASGLWTGWMDVALTEKGKQQAESLRPLLGSVKFDKFFSSDLSRAINTAKIAIPNCDPEPLSVLREIHIGSLQGTPVPQNADDSLRLRIKTGYAEFGGESREAFRVRVSEFIQYLESLQDVENVVAFSHGGFSRTFLQLVTDANLSAANMRCYNCCVMIFDFVDRTWYLHSVINM